MSKSIPLIRTHTHRCMQTPSRLFTALKGQLSLTLWPEHLQSSDQRQSLLIAADSYVQSDWVTVVTIRGRTPQVSASAAGVQPNPENGSDR